VSRCKVNVYRLLTVGLYLFGILTLLLLHFLAVELVILCIEYKFYAHVTILVIKKKTVSSANAVLSRRSWAHRVT